MSRLTSSENRPFERALVRAARRELVKRCAYIINEPGNAARVGLPDFIVCLYGKFIGIELKARGQKARRRQLHELKRIRRAGGVGIVVDSIEQLRKELDALAVG